MKKDPDEPTIRELFGGVSDFLFSNSLTDVLKRKLGVRSYWEFFNRAIGIGFILVIVGALPVFAAWASGSEANLQLFGFDLRWPVIVLAVIGALWVLSEFIKWVNVGSGIDERLGEYFHRYWTIEPTFRLVLLGQIVGSIIYAVILYWVLLQFNTGSGGLLGTIEFFLVLSVLFGVLLILVGYFLRSLFGVISLVRGRYGGQEVTGPDEVLPDDD